MRFEDRLLTELKHAVAEAPRVLEFPRRRTAWRARLAIGAAVAAAMAIAVGVVLPTSRGPQSGNTAWAVAENDDGTVTVEIRDIRDADGLERKLEEVGLPAGVHYLPQNKSCAPPGLAERMRGDSTTMAREEAAMAVKPTARGAVRIRESGDGVFVFTVDKSKFEPDYMVVVFAEHDIPEHEQQADTVASIQAGVVRGHYYEDCNLVDGSMEGWGFQQGAKPGDK